MSDYISRKAAVKIAQKYGLANGSALGRHTGLADCIAIEIEGLPAADVEPVRHGRWISLTDCSNAGVYCSICHKKVYKEDYAWCNRKNKVRSPYCPNCGSKMDLEDETNDD